MKMNARKQLIAAVLAGTMVALASMMPAAVSAETVWDSYNQAVKLETKKDYTGAINKYKTAVPQFLAKKEYGNAGQMHRRIGENYVKLGNYDKAVENWDLESSYYAKVGRTQDSIAVKYKANRLRSSASLYYETAVEPSGGKLALLEPANGVLLGAYAEQDPAVHNPKNGKPFYTEQFPILTGKHHAGYLIYFTYGQPLSVIRTHIAKAKANGAALQIGLQPLKGIDEVKDDAYLHQFAKDLKEAGIPFFLRFANEMNGKWVPWYSTPKQYIEKFRIVADVVHQEAPDNVAMVYAPNPEPENTIQDYYPGDAYVDWVGISLYSIFNPKDDPLKLGEDRTSHLGKLDAVYKLFANRKPIMISEGAISYMYPEKMLDKSDWAVYKVHELYGTLPLLYPKIKANFWFDTNHDAARIKYYQLSANARLLQAYKDVIASPYYLGAVGDESSIAYRPMAVGSVPAAKLKVAGYVKTWAPVLSRVTYEINGRKVGEAQLPPWRTDIDFAAYAGKNVAVVVKAYGPSGSLVTTNTVKVTVQ
ncbi:glycoside hydrolase family 26 protein [Paenibacillus gansuensis]|uniref:Glycoside hydrolase family 26 protein n=1 Tax=Paenibacillus gansuensis TaxID=306542 RepID=A0ABW5PK48_9BACL